MTGTKPMIARLNRFALLLGTVLAMMVSTLATLPATAQEVSPEHLDLARKYLELTDHAGIYEASVVQAGINTYRQLLPQDPDIGPQLNTAIETVIASYKGKKGELFDQLARVYALTFSPDELTEIVNFYGSPTGTKLAKANAQLNATVQRVMNIFSVNLNTEFFAKVRSELKAVGIDS